MSSRKHKELYQEGFLCLFDKHGEMFFRPKTELLEDAPNWLFQFRERIHYRDVSVDQRGIDYDEYGLATTPWSVHTLDLRELYTYDEGSDNLEFTGHFDLSIRGPRGSLLFSFGEGRMDVQQKVDSDGCLVFDHETWEWEFSSMEFYPKEKLELLRVNID